MQVTQETIDQLAKPLNIYLYVGPYVDPEKPEVSHGVPKQIMYVYPNN